MIILMTTFVYILELVSIFYLIKLSNAKPITNYNDYYVDNDL